MQAKVLPYSRAPQILNLLKDYGPMSVKGLQQIIIPQMSTRALQILLQRLHNKGLLIKRYEKLWQQKAVFHQLGQKDFQLKAVADFLRCSLDSLRQPEYRYRELMHTEACAIWAHHLKCQFPELILLRDFQIDGDEAALQSLLNIKSDVEVKPDLLLKLPKINGSDFTIVGVEIEKTRKSDSRLVMKLAKYARRTSLDGVLYVCDSGGLSETLRSIYKNKVIAESMRVKHYAENFFMFTEGVPNDIGASTIVRNSITQEISLHRWLHFLRSTSDTTRKAASQNLFRTSERSLQEAAKTSAN